MDTFFVLAATIVVFAIAYVMGWASGFWGHVYRFMNGLAQREITETTRTQNVWRKMTLRELLK